MSKVVIHLFDDEGHLQAESTLIEHVAMHDAECVMGTAVNAVACDSLKEAGRSFARSEGWTHFLSLSFACDVVLAIGFLFASVYGLLSWARGEISLGTFDMVMATLFCVVGKNRELCRCH
jgi:hypothetical protein